MGVSASSPTAEQVRQVLWTGRRTYPDPVRDWQDSPHGQSPPEEDSASASYPGRGGGAPVGYTRVGCHWRRELDITSGSNLTEA